MDVSLSSSSSLGFPAKRPLWNSISHRIKVAANTKGRFSEISSRSSRILCSSQVFHGENRFLKLASIKSFGCNAKSIRACVKHEADKSDSTQARILTFSFVLWRFLRPHVVRGTVLQYISLMARTLIENSQLLNWSLPTKAFALLTALLCAQAFTAGINQIFDVEIDKINKPYLPIAAGDLSPETAWLIVTSYVAISISAAGVLSSGVFLASIYSLMVLGFIYSVPPIRWKESTIGALLVCASTGGFVPILGVSAAARASVGLSFELSLPVAFIAIFMSVFGAVLGAMKDLEDVEGDKKFGVKTLATILGKRNIALLGSGILLLNYVGAILAAIYFPQVFRGSIMMPAHIVLALRLIFLVRRLVKTNYSKEESQLFHLSLWGLVGAEYMLFPFI